MTSFNDFIAAAGDPKDPWFPAGVQRPQLSVVRDPVKSEYGRHRIALKLDGLELTWQWFAPEVEPAEAMRELLKQWLR